MQSGKMRPHVVWHNVSGSTHDVCSNIPRLEGRDSGADRLYDTTEFVSENVALLQLDNAAVEQMQI
jgi:hypothetical protein